MAPTLEPRGDSRSQPPETKTETPDYSKVLKDYLSSYTEASAEMKGKDTSRLHDVEITNGDVATAPDGSDQALDGSDRIAEEPEARGATGTLVWHPGPTQTTTAQVENGLVKDKDGKVIGRLQDDGQVSLDDGSSFNIKESEGAAFHGIGSDGQALELVSASQEGSLTGAFVSPDGKQKYSVVNGNIYNETGGFEGNIDADGVVTSIAPDGRTTYSDLNTRFTDWMFKGTENGHERAFQASNDLVSGTLSLPGENGEFTKYDVKLGMLINHETGEQTGWLTAPTETADGTLVGGFVYQRGADGQVHDASLASFQYASFDLRSLGTTGLETRDIIGVSLGLDNGPGIASGYLNIQKANDLEGKVIDKARGEIEAIDKRDNFYKPAHWLGYNDDATKAEKAEIRYAQMQLAHYQAQIAAGEFDATSVAEIMRRMNADSRELKEGAKAGDRSGTPDLNSQPIEIPKLDEETVKTVDGKLRMGEEVYEIKDGELYRVSQSQVDGETVSVTDQEASGRLNADYTVDLEGRGTVSLAEQNRVLMEFTIGDSEFKNQLIGLGASKWTEAFGYTGGGLVDIRQLRTRMNDTIFDASQGTTDYYKVRPDSTGILGNWANGGTEEMLQRFSDGMFKDKQTMDTIMADTFEHGFDVGDLDTVALNNRIAFTQTLVEGLGLSAADSTRIAQEGIHMQKLINNGVVAGITGVATVGLGSLLAAANAAKVIQLSRLGMMAAEVGGGGVLGAGISVVGRASESSDWTTNAGSGFLEGALMGAGGAGGRWMSELSLSGLAKGIYYGSDAITQSTGFDIAQMMREGGNISEAFGVRRMLIGTGAMLLGRAAGNANIPGVRSGSLAQEMVQTVSSSGATGFVQGVDQGFREQDEAIARKLGMKLEDISQELLDQYRDYSSIIDTAFETATVSAATSVATTPLTHGFTRMVVPPGGEATVGGAGEETRGSTATEESIPSIHDPEPFTFSYEPGGIVDPPPFTFVTEGSERRRAAALAEGRTPSLSDPEPFTFSFLPEGIVDPPALSFVPEGSPLTTPLTSSAESIPSIHDPEPFTFIYEPGGIVDPPPFTFVTDASESARSAALGLGSGETPLFGANADGDMNNPTAREIREANMRDARGVDAEPGTAGGGLEAQDGSEPTAQDGGIPEAQDGGEPSAQDGGVSEAQDGGDLAAQDGGVPEAQDSGRPTAQDGGVPPAQAGGGVPQYSDILPRLTPFEGKNVGFQLTEKIQDANKWMIGYVDRFMQGGALEAYRYLNDPANNSIPTSLRQYDVVLSTRSLDPAIAGGYSAEAVLQQHLTRMGDAGTAQELPVTSINKDGPFYAITEPRTVLELSSGTTIDVMNPATPLQGGELTTAERSEIERFLTSEAGQQIMDRHAMILAEERAHVRQMDNNYMVVSESFARFIENNGVIRPEGDPLLITGLLSADENNLRNRPNDTVEIELPGMFHDAGLPIDLIKEHFGHSEIRKPFIEQLERTAAQEAAAQSTPQGSTADEGGTAHGSQHQDAADATTTSSQITTPSADAEPSLFEASRRLAELNRLRDKLDASGSDFPEELAAERAKLRAQLFSADGENGLLPETLKGIREIQPQLLPNGHMEIPDGAAGPRMEAIVWNDMVDLMDSKMPNSLTPKQMGFELVKVTPGTAADGIGWDMLLINKRNGEFIPIDVKDKKSLANYPPFHQENAIQIQSYERATQQQEVVKQFGKIISRMKADGSPLNVLDFNMPKEMYPLADVFKNWVLPTPGNKQAWDGLNLMIEKRDQMLTQMIEQFDNLKENYQAAGDKASARVVGDLIEHIDRGQRSWLHRVQTAARKRDLDELRRLFN